MALVAMMSISPPSVPSTSRFAGSTPSFEPLGPSVICMPPALSVSMSSMTVGVPATVWPAQPTIPTITATNAVMSPTRPCPARTAVPNAPVPAACPSAARTILAGSDIRPGNRFSGTVAR
jgi:hypothetical protein